MGLNDRPFLADWFHFDVGRRPLRPEYKNRVIYMTIS